MEAGVKGPGTMNFDRPPKTFTVILPITTFDLQHFQHFDSQHLI